MKAWACDAAPFSFGDLIFAGRKAEMRRQLETAIEASLELKKQDDARSTAGLLDAPELPNASDAGLQAPMRGAVSVSESDAGQNQVWGLPKLLRLLWTKRQVTLQWAMAGFWSAILLTLVIPKQYVSTAKLMPPEAKSARNLAVHELTGGFGSMAGDLLGVSSTGALVVAIMRSRTVEDRMIGKFNLKKVYRVGLEQKARTRLEVKTSFSVEPKTGIVVLSVTDSDPQRAAAMVRAYVEELDTLMAQLNNSSGIASGYFCKTSCKS